MSDIKIIKQTNYSSLVSSRKYYKGDVLLKLEGIISFIPDKYSIQVGENAHIHAELNSEQSVMFMFINHSCNPNSFVDIEMRTLIALRNIIAEEEIVYNYNSTEYDIAYPFICNCGSNSCIHEIKGFKYLTTGQQKNPLSYLPQHLKNIFYTVCAQG